MVQSSTISTDGFARGSGRIGAVGVGVGRVVLAISVALVGSLGDPGGVARAQAIHCARNVVMLGDAQADVLRKCGPPTRRQSLSGSGKSAVASSATARATKPRKRSSGGHGREAWIYDLGSRQLVRVLTFEHGRLVGIDVAGYGGR